MVNEHVITVRKDLSQEHLAYIVEKAHRLGAMGRKIIRVYSEKDPEGTHYYFECSPPKEH